MNVLVIDIGGTNVKMLATGQQEPIKFHSGPARTAKAMVAGVQKRTRDWKFDVISVGYPGPVLRGCPEEVALGGGIDKKLKELPLHCRAGENADAFRRGFRLWEKRVTSGHLPVRIA